MSLPQKPYFGKRRSIRSATGCAHVFEDGERCGLPRGLACHQPEWAHLNGGHSYVTPDQQQPATGPTREKENE